MLVLKSTLKTIFLIPHETGYYVYTSIEDIPNRYKNTAYFVINVSTDEVSRWIRNSDTLLRRREYLRNRINNFEKRINKLIDKKLTPEIVREAEKLLDELKDIKRKFEEVSL